MIFTQEAPLTRKWFSGRSCIRSNWNKLGVNFEEGGNRSARSNLRSGVPFAFVGAGKERLIQLLDYSPAAP